MPRPPGGRRVNTATVHPVYQPHFLLANFHTLHQSGYGLSSDGIDQARFTPGTMLTGRYRIVGLLGKGGMGEVYRADDLKPRQSVALEFLPAELSKHSRRLERFHHEVRAARRFRA